MSGPRTGGRGTDRAPPARGRSERSRPVRSSSGSSAGVGARRSGSVRDHGRVRVPRRGGLRASGVRAPRREQRERGRGSRGRGQRRDRRRQGRAGRRGRPGRERDLSRAVLARRRAGSSTETSCASSPPPAMRACSGWHRPRCCPRPPSLLPIIARGSGRLKLAAHAGSGAWGRERIPEHGCRLTHFHLSTMLRAKDPGMPERLSVLTVRGHCTGAAPPAHRSAQRSTGLTMVQANSTSREAEGSRFAVAQAPSHRWRVVGAAGSS